MKTRTLVGAVAVVLLVQCVGWVWMRSELQSQQRQLSSKLGFMCRQDNSGRPDRVLCYVSLADLAQNGEYFSRGEVSIIGYLASSEGRVTLYPSYSDFATGNEVNGLAIRGRMAAVTSFYNLHKNSYVQIYARYVPRRENAPRVFRGTLELISGNSASVRQSGDDDDRLLFELGDPP